MFFTERTRDRVYICSGPAVHCARPFFRFDNYYYYYNDFFFFSTSVLGGTVGRAVRADFANKKNKKISTPYQINHHTSYYDGVRSVRRRFRQIYFYKFFFSSSPSVSPAVTGQCIMSYDNTRPKTPGPDTRTALAFWNSHRFSSALTC